MKVFIAYARTDRELAESLALRIRGAGHEVFFDRDQLKSTGAFDATIRQEMTTVDFLVFIASSDSLSEDSYAGAELAQFRKRFPSPSGRLLTVLTPGCSLKDLSAYARSVSVPEPTGDRVAFYSSEALDALERLRRRTLKPRLIAGALILLLGVVGASLLGYMPWSSRPEPTASEPIRLSSQEGSITRIPDPKAGEGDLFRVRASVDLAGRGSESVTLGIEFDDDDYLPLRDLDHPDLGFEGPPGGLRTFVATLRILEVPTARNLSLFDMPALRWRLYAVGEGGESVLATSDWFDWDPNAPEASGSATVAPVPGDLFGRFEAVCSIPAGGFAAALAQPASIVLLTDNGLPTENRKLLGVGRVTCVAAVENTIFVGVAAPAKVFALDARTLETRWEDPVPELELEREWGTVPLAIEPTAIGWIDDALWIATAGGSSEPGLLLRWGNHNWEALDGYDDFVIDPEDMLLRFAGEELWSVQTNTTPGGIALMRPGGPIPFGGHDHDLAAELSDLSSDFPSPSAEALKSFLACDSDGSVNRIRRNNERLEQVSLVMHGIHLTDPVETWTESRLAVFDGQHALVATTAGSMGSTTPLWTQLRLSTGNESESERIFQRNAAGVRSLAAGPDSGILILELPNGQTEAYRISEPAK